jgi:uncharacterized protein (TIGR01619 family)
MNMSFIKNAKSNKVATESWDYYYCLVDSKPAIISLDLNLVEKVPDVQLPFLYYISVKLKNPTKDGFPTPQELVELCKMEDYLLETVILRTSSVFCGRVTTDGSRDLILYVRNPEVVEKLSDQAMKQYPDYKFECGKKEDIEWDFYIDFLFPNERELNTIYNNRYLAELNKAGDCNSQMRSIKHTLYFPNETHRDDFILKVIDEYFQVEKIEKLPDETKNKWKTTIARMDNVEVSKINHLTLHLLDLAKKHQGMYEGWITVPVRMSDTV